MSDYYTESQMQRIEQAAYDGAMLEAGKEWERQRYEFGATEAELAARIAELEEEQVILKDQQREAKNILIDKNLHIDSLYEEGYKLQQRIAELEAAQRWIPVSERLPELRDSKAVLVYTKSGETYSGLYLGNNEWTGLLHDFREGDVTHWMPLPEPPEVQE